MAPATHRRQRRDGAEIRELVLRSARDLFAERGYSGATTKAIAERAAVTEATLFRTFTSKEKLFEAAIVEPFEQFLLAFTESWMHAPIPGGTPEDVLPQFVRGVYELVRRHDRLFTAMTSSNLLGTHARPALDRLEQLGVTIAETHALPFDARVAVRAATTAVVSVAMLQDDLFPPDSGITSDRVIDELARMLIGAARYRPPE